MSLGQTSSYVLYVLYMEPLLYACMYILHCKGVSTMAHMKRTQESHKRFSTAQCPTHHQVGLLYASVGKIAHPTNITPTTGSNIDGRKARALKPQPKDAFWRRVEQGHQHQPEPRWVGLHGNHISRASIVHFRKGLQVI